MNVPVAQIRSALTTISLVLIRTLSSWLIDVQCRLPHRAHIVLQRRLMAVEMDQKIREHTHGKKRLRDSLRAMVKWGEQSHGHFRLRNFQG